MDSGRRRKKVAGRVVWWEVVLVVEGKKGWAAGLALVVELTEAAVWCEVAGNGGN